MKKKLLCGSLILALLLTLFTACAGAGTDNNSMKAEGSSPDFYDRSDYGYMEKDVALETEVAWEKYPEEEIADGSAGEATTDYREKIIKNVSLSAQTKEYDKALKEILTALDAVGGYEESVESAGKGYNAGDYYTRYATLRLRIPADRLDAFLNEVGDMINVTNRSVSQSNVTSQYYDTQARLAVLESERIAYEAMLEKAQTVEELLLIKDRLYDTIREIEAHKTTLKVYDSKVSYSTVSIHLSEVKEYEQVVSPKTSFGTKLANAFRDSWRAFGEGCQNLAVWFVGAIPALLVWALIITAIVFAVIGTVKKVKKNRRNNTDPQE